MSAHRLLTPRFLILSAMTLAAALSRLLPHPPNFAPIGALALFGGACFSDRRAAFGVPLAALFLSDLVLGLHPLIPAVYGSFALIVVLGFWLRTRRKVVPIACASLAGSILFFALTNFAVWAAGSFYPKSWEGLVACYIAAIPFFYNTLLGDAAYGIALFGGLKLAERASPRLCEPRPQAA
ncbi:MAG TPA: DUF6580 family putative transport protein [Gemmataceae bacterium]|jgi:hypothetical protein